MGKVAPRRPRVGEHPRRVRARDAKLIR